MGLIRYLAEAIEGHRLYPVEEIKIPEKPSLVIIFGADQEALKRVRDYWNENKSAPEGTVLTNREVTIKEIKDAIRSRS